MTSLGIGGIVAIIVVGVGILTFKIIMIVCIRRAGCHQRRGS